MALTPWPWPKPASTWCRWISWPEQYARSSTDARLAPPPAIVAAGGINEHNAGAYAATGCAALVTSAPYWARPVDIKVTIETAPSIRC
ncbi:MAG: hypothetical protein U1E43_05795 [Rhodospirillales bacterium]